MSSTSVIDIEGISFSYQGPIILKDVSLSIEPGEMVAIIGPNGGGKTTLLKLMLGLLDPNQGRVRVFGEAPQASWTRIGYMPQYANLDPHFPVTVIDTVLMGRLGCHSRFGPMRRRDRKLAMEKIAEVGLTDVAHRPLSALSGGQRQRVLIARALVTEPDLLLLDEPTANLDMKVETQLYELLENLNRHLTIVLVSHDLGFVSPLVDRVICVNRKVVMHPTSEITGEVISEIYGSEVRLVRHDHRCGGESSC